MNVLVIGASGFLGGHVFRQMTKKENHRAIGTYLHHLPSESPALRQTDLASIEAVRDLIRDTNPDAILWCAKSSITEDETILHESGLTAVLDGLHHRTRLVFVSTDGVLPGERGPYDEWTVPKWIPGDDRIASYTNAKLTAENLIRQVAQNYCIVRTGPIFGKGISGQWDSRTFSLLSSLEQGEGIARPQNLLRTFCDVRDLAQAVCELSWSEVEGILHVGSPVPDSYYSYAVSCARVFGYPAEGIEPFRIPLEDAIERHVRLDTTMNTDRCVASLQTRFRTVEEALSEYAVEE